MLRVGSSPRLWGTLKRPDKCRNIFRFIPTPVGNTQTSFLPGVMLLVHPHACGEHLAIPSNSTTSVGSSPRLWGTQAGGDRHIDRGRFFPTPVGNTTPSPAMPRQAPVHPHACGEHGNIPLPGEAISGSSPRLWGTRFHPRGPLSGHRFIPTPVGNTPGHPAGRLPPAVHPHACGEHKNSRVPGLSRFGSSPRLWGTHTLKIWPLHVVRFIPTPVGNTYSISYSCIGWTVHPHACGEHRGSANDFTVMGGSSPRLWGTQCP